MSVFLSNAVIAFLLAEFVLLVLMSISLFYVVRIVRSWDYNALTSLQYSLEKQNYLVNTILLFCVCIKIVLFIFFALCLNELSDIVPGAMCSAGVIGSNKFGGILMLTKILLIFGLGIWLVINKLDLQALNFPYLKRKYAIFICLFVMILLELGIEISFFYNIPLKVPVFCCSVTFQAPKLPFGYTNFGLVSVFFVLFFVILVLNFLKQSMASFVANLLFLVLSYYAITYFFGLYVYEQPNHKCPYCMLKGDYFYVGYLIWGSLFLGVFYGLMPYLVEIITKTNYSHKLKFSSIWLSVCVLICALYVLKYYLLRGFLF